MLSLVYLHTLHNCGERGEGEREGEEERGEGKRYRVAKTYSMPFVACHFPQKNH